METQKASIFWDPENKMQNLFRGWCKKKSLDYSYIKMVSLQNKNQKGLSQ